MNKTIGKVIEIYIPEQYKNNNLLDIMDRTNITFKIMTNNGLKEVTVEQNEEKALTLQARGFSNPVRRTTLNHLQKSAIDYVLDLIFVLILVAFIIWGGKIL